MNGLEKSYKFVRDTIDRSAREAGRSPQSVKLVAVSKEATAEQVVTLAALGHTDFGENRLPQGLKKLRSVNNPALQWHMIGRIQTNKIKFLNDFSLIHSLDRWKLAEKLSSYAQQQGVVFDCLVQVNVSRDRAKAGVDLSATDDFVQDAAALEGLRILGLMTITAEDADKKTTRGWFDLLADKYTRLKEREFPAGSAMEWLSMGMSNDYPEAVAAGANIVRIGSAIFREGRDI